MPQRHGGPRHEERHVEVEIESLDASGDGIARYGRQQITVPFTIPGERVRVHLDPRRRDIQTATLLEIVRPSPHRVVARCPHFGPGAEPGVGACGGCTWQHIAYREQLRLKTALVTQLVRESVPDAPAARPMLPSTSVDDPWRYRHKVHFVFAGDQNDTIRMGHYVRASRRLVPVRECPVHDERGNALAFALRDAYAPDSARSRGGNERQGRARANLKSVAIRVALNTPDIQATLVTRTEADRRLRAATHRVLSGPLAPTALHVNVHPRDDAYIFGRETRRLVGPDRIREQVDGTTFAISPTAFFQTNVRAAEILVRLVLDAMPERAIVLDLYAGAGLFALPLARAGCTVIAVEGSRAAVADGQASARINRIPPARCRFIAHAVEIALPRLDSLRLPRFDAVVIDPPREGCARAVLRTIFDKVHPARAIYISCNPEALARDLRYLVRVGYTVDSIQPVDMFPHTAHIESVVVLTRR